MATISERLRVFAQGCRGSMWQSRDETIVLMDEAADTIDALVAALEDAREAIASLDENALGMATGTIHGEPLHYPLRDELRHNIDAALALVRKETSNV